MTTNEQEELHVEPTQHTAASGETAPLTEEPATQQTDAEPSTAPDEAPPGFVSAVMGELVALKREIALVNYHKDVLSQTIPSLALAAQDRLLSPDAEEQRKAVTEIVGAANALASAATSQVREMTEYLAKRMDTLAESAYQPSTGNCEAHE